MTYGLKAFQRIFSRVKPGQKRTEGIGVAVFVVGISVMAAALAAPRATEPDVLPLPLPDRTVLQRQTARTRDLAREARAAGLSYDVRAVGEAIRRCGAATVEGQGVQGAVLGEVRLTVRLARERKSEQGLLGLLAVQTELFLDATHAFEKTGQPSRDLRELGGDFLATAKQSGWLDGKRIVLDDHERAALFRLRWTELTGLRGEAAFAPTLDEYRAYYALYLLPTAGVRRAEAGERAVSAVRALEKRDPSYPGTFARGVLFYRAGMFHEAADAFHAHLEVHPDGPWALRARNHLLAALAKTGGDD